MPARGDNRPPVSGGSLRGIGAARMRPRIRWSAAAGARRWQRSSRSATTIGGDGRERGPAHAARPDRPARARPRRGRRRRCPRLDPPRRRVVRRPASALARRARAHPRRARRPGRNAAGGAAAQQSAQADAARELERMLADPSAHRWVRVSKADLGLSGCTRLARQPARRPAGDADGLVAGQSLWLPVAADGRRRAATPSQSSYRPGGAAGARCRWGRWRACSTVHTCARRVGCSGAAARKSGRADPPLRLALASLGGLDTAPREHFAGFRSHTMMLAGLPAVARRRSLPRPCRGRRSSSPRCSRSPFCCSYARLERRAG